MKNDQVLPMLYSGRWHCHDLKFKFIFLNLVNLLRLQIHSFFFFFFLRNRIIRVNGIVCFEKALNCTLNSRIQILLLITYFPVVIMSTPRYLKLSTFFKTNDPVYSNYSVSHQYGRITPIIIIIIII